MWVRTRDNVVPVEHELAEAIVPTSRIGRQRRVREALDMRVGVGVEGSLRIARIPGPPADSHLLGVHRVAHDEVRRRRLGGRPGEQADGEVERSPPGIDGGRAAAVGGPVRGEHQRSAGGGGEVALDRVRVVARVLPILVERNRPPHLLRGGVDLHRARQRRGRLEHLACHLAHGAIGCQRDPAARAVAVLGERLMAVEIESEHDSPRAVGGREVEGFMTARGQSQRRVLKLGLRRRERGGQLSDHLRMRVQRVAGLAPVLVIHGRPIAHCHTPV